MWRGVPFARQRRPIIDVLRMCWLLPGSFDCFCCPHTSVHRPSIVCLCFCEAQVPCSSTRCPPSAPQPFAHTEARSPGLTRDLPPPVTDSVRNTGLRLETLAALIRMGLGAVEPLYGPQTAEIPLWPLEPLFPSPSGTFFWGGGGGGGAPRRSVHLSPALARLPVPWNERTPKALMKFGLGPGARRKRPVVTLLGGVQPQRPHPPPNKAPRGRHSAPTGPRIHCNSGGGGGARSLFANTPPPV